MKEGFYQMIFVKKEDVESTEPQWHNKQIEVYNYTPPEGYIKFVSEDMYRDVCDELNQLKGEYSDMRQELERLNRIIDKLVEK